MYDPITGELKPLFFGLLAAATFLLGMLIIAAIEYLIMPEVKKWRAEKARENEMKWAGYRKLRKRLLQATGVNGDKRSQLIALSRDDYLRIALPSEICEPFYEQKNFDNKDILKFKEKLDFYMKENFGREK